MFELHLSFNEENLLLVINHISKYFFLVYLIYKCLKELRVWIFYYCINWKFCLQVSYAIGVAEPLSISIFHYGTSAYTSQQLLQIVQNNFDLRPGRIVKDLDLCKPVYKHTSCYGHFGRNEFTWEQPKTLVIPKF